MYKILYLTQFAQVGGGETALLNLISKLDKKKFETHVVLPRKGQFYNRLKKLNVKIHILTIPPYLVRMLFVPGMSPFALTKLLKLAREINPDLIHVNHLTLSIYAGVVAKILKIPTIGTAHGIWDSLYFYQNLIYKFFINRIIANTYKTANNIKKHKFYPSKNIETIYFGIDTNLYKPPTNRQKIKAKKSLNIPPDHIVVSNVGRLDPQKDHLTFLKCANIIIQKTNMVRFLIIGSKEADFSSSSTRSNYLTTLKDFIGKNRELSDYVKFIPYQENMTAIYQATDILVSTSSSQAESFGLALVEAASCTIPVVSTKTASQHQIVKNGQTGQLVKPHDPKVLAEKIFTLVNNPQLRKTFGINGRNHVIKNFQLSRYVNEVEKNYLKLLGFQNN